MTVPPSYRKVNPADAPVLFIALTSPSLSLSDLNDYAEHLISPTLSTLDGVAQVNIYGQKRFAVRVRVQPDALAARNISLDELDQRAARGQRQHAGRHARRPGADADAAGQPAAAQRRRVRRADRQQQATAARCACATWRTVEDSFEIGQDRGGLQRRDARSRWRSCASPTPTRCKVVDAVRAALPGFQSQLPQSVQTSTWSTTARSRSAPRCTT